MDPNEVPEFQPINVPKGTAHRRKRAASPTTSRQPSPKRQATHPRRPSSPQKDESVEVMPRTAAMKKKKDHCPILELPAELRVQMFEHALTKPGEVTVPVFKEGALCFGLLRVNKQFLKEAGEVAYGNNTFKFKVLADVSRFLDVIGQMKGFVKHLDFTMIMEQLDHLFSSEVHQIYNRLKETNKLATIAIRHTKICKKLDFNNHKTSLRFDQADSGGICRQILAGGMYRFLLCLYKSQALKTQTSEPLNLFVLKTVALCKPGGKCCCFQDGHEPMEGCRGMASHCEELASQFNAYCASKLQRSNEDIEREEKAFSRSPFDTRDPNWATIVACFPGLVAQKYVKQWKET